MGGLGSGRWSVRGYLDDCISIDIRQWRREGCLRPGVRFTSVWDTAASPKQSISVEVEVNRLVLKYQWVPDGQERQDVELPILWTAAGCHYGGCRMWFQCPACYLRAAKLYLQASTFVCRTCSRLPYQSQSESRTDRAARKSARIRMQLQAGRNDAVSMLLRPKGMHRLTFDRLKKCLVEAETIRLLPFQKWLEKLR